MEHTFQEGDSVFCYEPLLGRIRALYEAKVLSVVKRRTRESTYRLRFFDWNKIYSDRTKRCDYEHDVPESFVCKATQIVSRLMHKLTRNVNQCEGDDKEKAKLVSEIIVQFYKERKIQRLPPGLALDEEDSKLDTSPEDNLSLMDVKADKGDVDKEGESEVVIELDEELKKTLDHDCTQIKGKQKLQVMSGPSVIDILESFLRYYANILLFEKPKNAKDQYKPEHRISLTKEVLEGLRCLFDTILPTNLLYSEELSSHEHLVSSGAFPVAQQNLSSPMRRRQTRSSTAETPQQTTDSATPSQTIQRSASDTSKVTAAAQQLLARLEQNKDSPSEGPVSKKQRLAPHLLQSNIGNSASGRSTPTQQNLQSELLMKEVNEWKLVPKAILAEMDSKGTPLPSAKYGAIHLLRLFVMLPSVLTRMKLVCEWKSFLLGIFTALLSFFLEERKLLLDNVTYSSSDCSLSS